MASLPNLCAAPQKVELTQTEESQKRINKIREFTNQLNVQSAAESEFEFEFKWQIFDIAEKNKKIIIKEK